MRKSLKDISWQVPETEYRQDEAFSYSTLARFSREGFEKLDKLYDKLETPSLLFGSVVDTLLTGSLEEFEENFLVADLPELSDQLKNITKTLFALYSDKYNNFNDIPDNILADVGKQCDYYSNSRYDSYRVKLIKENCCASLYQTMFLSQGKKLVSTEEYNDANECVERLKTSPYTSWYFDSAPDLFKDVERLYQLKFKGTYEGIPVRCMADLLAIDYTNKRIIPCDLKTSGKPEFNFFKSFIEWKYDIQARLYWYIIRQNMDKDEYFKDFTLENYRFIVINRFRKNPLVWEYEDTTKEGNLLYTSSTNYTYVCKDWREILKELNFYTNNPESVNPIGIKEINSITDWLKL